ncbi:hypothetical protein ACROYT_G006985 [Oculina patagonica]
MKEQVFLEVLSEVKGEVKKYAKDPECMSKVTNPAVVTSFINEAFYGQLQEKCPRLSLILAYGVKPRKARLYTSEELHCLSHKERNAICLAAASCLKQWNQQLSAAHYRISLLLLNGGAKSVTIDRCSQLVTTKGSQHSPIRMQTKAGETTFNWDSKDSGGSRDFHRIVSFVTDDNGKRLTFTKVENQFTGEEHRFTVQQHGNSKQAEKPYVGTQSSTITSLKERKEKVEDREIAYIKKGICVLEPTVILSTEEQFIGLHGVFLYR